MILIASREEKELIRHLRSIGPLSESSTQASVLTAEVIALKRQLVDLEIQKSKVTEEHEKQDRELRHMIGLERKRQEVELAQARKDTELQVREGNLVAEKKRFEDQLAFNTARFETMEKYLKDMMGDILARLPNVNVELKKQMS